MSKREAKRLRKLEKEIAALKAEVFYININNGGRDSRIDLLSHRVHALSTDLPPECEKSVIKKLKDIHTQHKLKHSFLG